MRFWDGRSVRGGIENHPFRVYEHHKGVRASTKATSDVRRGRASRVEQSHEASGNEECGSHAGHRSPTNV